METIKKTDYKKEEVIKLYWWNWNKVVQLTGTEHFRDEKFQWYKLSCEWTLDLWKTKYTIMLEWNELFELFIFLNWYSKEIICKRWNQQENKSITFFKSNTNDDLIKIDSSKLSEKIVLKLDLLNKMILTKILLNLLTKEIKRTTNVILSKEEIKEYILSMNLESKVANIQENKNLTTPTINDKKYYIEYDNEYKWEVKKNTIEIKKETYESLSKIDLNILSEEKKKAIVWKLKEINTTNWQKYFFLNLNNFNTITFKED